MNLRQDIRKTSLYYSKDQYRYLAALHITKQVSKSLIEEPLEHMHVSILHMHTYIHICTAAM